MMASLAALQALVRQINNQLKENAQQMQETNKDLKVSKTQDGKTSQVISRYYVTRKSMRQSTN